MYLHYLSFSSQWERLQHDGGEAGQLKGMKHPNCVGSCNVKCAFGLTWSLSSENTWMKPHRQSYLLIFSYNSG